MTPSEKTVFEPITSYEAKCLRIALAFGDPAGDDLPDPDLERAKEKLRAIEGDAERRTYPRGERDWRPSDPPSPFFVRHADALYEACEASIRGGRLDARSKIGDATLDYRQERDEMAGRRS